ncbi:glycosyltransferase family 2 protein [Bacteroides sp. 224]|uniref:glycosyltransferase family 2 protein n=1 Tax=Bacteroides sp. 224 TaxID=2302936 RepID=UPI0013CFFE34|nr:glycosyltransferase family 2 protein [Bacteroides sp. 224]NDV64295.1 glycosyltransferase family 2 protein [Bacteroides sp. 224]
MENTNSKILLSICIPTYNRAHVLKDTIEHIVQDPAFDKEVELIISDNNSDDETQSVVESFMSTYSNIYYYKNEIDIGNRNFQQVLSYGKGEYLKLLNDYTYFGKGKLFFMKQAVREYQNSHASLFFFNKVKKKYRTEELLECNSLDEFIQRVSYTVTWISNFGCWRSDFERMEQKDRYVSYLLQQEEWIYKIVSCKKKAIIFPFQYLASEVMAGKSRGGYNYFKVHIENYYKIMLDFVRNGYLSEKVYKEDRRYTLWRFKRRFFRYLIYPNKRYLFDTEKSYEILWYYYREFPEFYLVLFMMGVLFIVKSPYKLLKYLLNKG